jgi:CHAT domain-containing protein
VLVGRDASVDRVLSEMTGATTLHLAAHGRLRRDNPLFSSLLLDDGPLTVYDLESLPSVPAEIVLSACSAGAGHALVGDELLGLAWTLLAAGARNVLAPLLPVPDRTTIEVMTLLHQELAQHDDLAGAWRDVHRQMADDEALGPVVAAFTLYGA